MLLDGEKHKCKDIEDGFDLKKECASIVGVARSKFDVFKIDAKDKRALNVVDLGIDEIACTTSSSPLKVAVVPKGSA